MGARDRPSRLQRCLIRRDARIETPSDPHRSDHTLPPASIHGGRLTAPEHDALLHVLAPDDRAAFVVTQLLGFSYDEAAEVADVPVGTIRSRVHRARSRLADLWPSSDATATTTTPTDTTDTDEIPGKAPAMDTCDARPPPPRRHARP